VGVAGELGGGVEALDEDGGGCAVGGHAMERLQEGGAGFRVPIHAQKARMNGAPGGLRSSIGVSHVGSCGTWCGGAEEVDGEDGDEGF